MGYGKSHKLINCTYRLTHSTFLGLNLNLSNLRILGMNFLTSFFLANFSRTLVSFANSLSHLSSPILLSKLKSLTKYELEYRYPFGAYIIMVSYQLKHYAFFVPRIRLLRGLPSLLRSFTKFPLIFLQWYLYSRWEIFFSESMSEIMGDA